MKADQDGRSSAEPRLQTLDVLVSRTLDGAQNGVHASVACPRHRRLASLTECARCDDFGGTREEGGALESLCRYRGHPLPLLPPANFVDVRTLAEATPVSTIAKSVVSIGRAVAVAQAATLILELDVSGLPVVGEQGRLVGVVSKTDLVRHAWHPGDLARDGRVPVAAIMSPEPISIRDTASIAEAARLMVEEGVHRLPVVGATGTVLGILSPIDVLDWLSR